MSRGTWERTPGRVPGFAYGAFTLYGWPFQTIRLPKPFVTPRRVGRPFQVRPATPGGQRLPAFTPTRFGLIPFRSPLLGASRLISFPRATKRFCFARCPLPPRGRDAGLQGPAGFPIRASPGHRLLAPHRGFSQLATPFLGSGRRGIHPEPLLACPPGTVGRTAVFSCQGTFLSSSQSL